MGTRVNVQWRMTDRKFREINRMPSVRARVQFVGDRIAARTRANLAAADVDAETTVESGFRKNGRAFTRVSHEDRFGEYGTEDRERHRALGRAIGSKY